MFHIWCLLACFLRLGDSVSCKQEDVFQLKDKSLTRQMAKGQKDKRTALKWFRMSGMVSLLNRRSPILAFTIPYHLSLLVFFRGMQVAEAGRCIKLYRTLPIFYTLPLALPLDSVLKISPDLCPKAYFYFITYRTSIQTFACYLKTFSILVIPLT